MKNLSSLASWLGHKKLPDRLPDIGMRELSVLEALWNKSNMTAQTLLDAMPRSGISLSTMQSTLERLHRKDLVRRDKIGRAYVYTAMLSRQNIISRLLHEIADNLADGDTAPMVSGFMDYLSGEEGKKPVDPRDDKTDKSQ